MTIFAGNLLPSINIDIWCNSQDSTLVDTMIWISSNEAKGLPSANPYFIHSTHLEQARIIQKQFTRK